MTFVRRDARHVRADGRVPRSRLDSAIPRSASDGGGGCFVGWHAATRTTTGSVSSSNRFTGLSPARRSHSQNDQPHRSRQNRQHGQGRQHDSPVNKPNLPNIVNNSDIANLRNMANIATWPISRKGPTQPTAPQVDRRPVRAGATCPGRPRAMSKGAITPRPFFLRRPRHCCALSISPRLDMCEVPQGSKRRGKVEMDAQRGRILERTARKELIVTAKPKKHRKPPSRVSGEQHRRNKDFGSRWPTYCVPCCPREGRLPVPDQRPELPAQGDDGRPHHRPGHGRRQPVG